MTGLGARDADVLAAKRDTVAMWNWQGMAQSHCMTCAFPPSQSNSGPVNGSFTFIVCRGGGSAAESGPCSPEPEPGSPLGAAADDAFWEGETHKQYDVHETVAGTMHGVRLWTYSATMSADLSDSPHKASACMCAAEIKGHHFHFIPDGQANDRSMG